MLALKKKILIVLFAIGFIGISEQSVGEPKKNIEDSNLENIQIEKYSKSY
jgi:hypothetical protein